MNKIISVSLLGLLLATPFSNVYAQESNNPNDSSFPASNQPGALPNDPDHNYGKAASTHALPSGVSPLSGTTSDPYKPQIPDKTNMPSNSDTTDKDH